ncbi:MAG TPA: HAD-IA family hydrolase [Candidatus Thermoplasmatota archaeon]|nr:HAD-IA family hydrolase [Candidatus Thermoplasmatota archaeon]
MTVKGVLFDLDNTLVDFMRMKRLASEEAARAMIGAGADFGVDAATAGKRLFEHYLNHGIESDDAFLSFLNKHNESRLSAGIAKQEAILAAGIQAYLRAKDVLLTPYPGVRRTLVELTRRGLKLGVVTDAPRLKGWQRLQALGIAEFFDVVITYHDSNAKKPDGRPFLMAVEGLGLRPFEVVMVGDWVEKDVRGARDAGLKTAWAQYGGRTPDGEHGADATLASITELGGILEAWRTS